MVAAIEIGWNDLDLTDADKALAWARRHIPDAFPDPGSDLPEKDALTEMSEANVEEYMNLYYQVGLADSIQVYRAIRLGPIDDLNTARIGNYWSYKPHGANQYQGPEDFGRIHVMTATVSPAKIDWPHGFASYMFYGSDQSEVAILPNSEILVTHLDGRPLDKPIKATTGISTRYDYHAA